MSALYGFAVVMLSGLALVFAGGVIVGEATDQWSFGGAMVGALLLTYSFIILLLRKMGIIGPRKTER